MPFSRSRSPGYVVNLAARLFAKAVDRVLQPYRLSSGSLPAFLILWESGPLTQKELAQLAVIEQPTMAATLSRMERDGVVVRAPHPTDKRSALFSLHDDARANAERVIEALNEVNDDALKDLSDNRRRELVEDLSAIAGRLEKRLKGTPD